MTSVTPCMAMNPPGYISNATKKDSYGNTNQGGWEACYGRKVTAQQYKQVFDWNWQKVISSTTNYTDNVGGGEGNVANNVTATQDYIFYLALKEITGNITYANSYEGNYQVRMQAYANGLSKVHYLYDQTGTASYIQLRSPVNDCVNRFFGLQENGAVEYCTSRCGDGTAPVFAVF